MYARAREVDIEEWLETVYNGSIADEGHESDAPADAPAVDVMTPEEAVVSSDDATMTQRRVIH